jgi:ribonuclease HII
MIDRLKHEIIFWNKGIKYIAGVDEVGRGCIAGPIVAASVILSPEITTFQEDSEDYQLLSQIKDSKKLSEKKRLKLDQFIKQIALEWQVHEMSNEDIDNLGVGVCNINVLQIATLNLQNVEVVFVDHFKISNDRFLTRQIDTVSIDNGDNLSISIAAASIIAKVYRDNLMKDKYHTLYPAYGFDTHVGYGTKKHIEAIKTHGYSDIHRKSFHLSL